MAYRRRIDGILTSRDPRACSDRLHPMRRGGGLRCRAVAGRWVVTRLKRGFRDSSDIRARGE